MFWSLVLSFRVRLDWSYAQAQETEVLVQMLSRFPSSIDPAAPFRRLGSLFPWLPFPIEPN